MVDGTKLNEKVEFNKISMKVIINDKEHLNINDIVATDFCWVDSMPKEILLKNLDRLWEQTKLKIIKLIYEE